GVCGLKPTYGALSLEGIRPLAPSLDHPGAIAGTVGGLARMWRVLSGGVDLAVAAAGPVVLGRVRGMFEERADANAVEAVELFLGAVGRAGARVVEALTHVSFDMILREHRLILAAEAAAIHEGRRREHPEEYPERIGRLIEEGGTIRAVDYLEAKGRLKEARRGAGGMLEGVDAIVCPAALGEAPGRSTTGEPAFQSPWSYLGVPTVCLPVAVREGGLPLGVQLVGRPGGEGALLGAALWCEQVLREA
ncbi:MAG: amidase, partial [Candidatus Rokubacteria bacterium]|nr:amidase [Candidatus Rokubacteria bacterium]